ncbi:exodeoxyribonuclease VII large subunit [Haloarculaceae archaeon H-GB11]|nr:exodeoxyribonuclease VII large subunit [Haloarculaceae archaeon H-GB11]
MGIATSRDSDAREDAITSLHARHLDVDVVVQDTPIQVDDAMVALMQAVSALDDDPTVDVIVLTRGGGADKHLRVFNETPLCRVIHGTDTPIVVGVGHERDRTLAADVADHRVMTPTDVGAIVPEKEALREEHANLAAQLDRAYERTVTTTLEETATALDDAYTAHTTAVLGRLEQDLDHALATHARDRLTALDTRLDHAVKRLAQVREHEAETTAYERRLRRLRRLRIALAMLVLLVLVLGAYVLTTL